MTKKRLLLMLLVTAFAGLISCGKDEGGGVEDKPLIDNPLIDNQLVGKWYVTEAWTYYYEGGGNYKSKSKDEWSTGQIIEFNADGTWKRTYTNGDVRQGDNWTFNKTDFNQNICPYEVWMDNQNGTTNEHLYLCGPNYTSFEKGATAVWMQERNMRQDNALPKVHDMYQYRATKIQ